MRKTLAERETLRRERQDKRGAEPRPETEEETVEREAVEAERATKKKAQKIAAVDREIARRPPHIDQDLSKKRKKILEDDRRALGWSDDPDTELAQLEAAKAELSK